MREMIPFYSNRLSVQRSVFDELDKLFNDVFGKEFFPGALARSGYPKMNVYDDNGNLCIDAYVPELPKDKIFIEVEDGILTLKGDANQDKEITSGKYYCREISKRAFSRSIKLPESIDEEKIEADHKDGVLKVRIPYRDIVKKKINKIDIT